MGRISRYDSLCRMVVASVVTFFFAALLTGCGLPVTADGNPLSYSSSYKDASLQQLTGDLKPVRDPAIISQNGTYYAFSTDVKGASAWPGNLPFFCSVDRRLWRYCGSVFTKVPAWVDRRLPGVNRLWAPDVSYFNGAYHLYYAATIAGTQDSVIGVATNVTLDPNDPAYDWDDQGIVLATDTGDDSNAIDPNILVDTDGRVWLTYGSYWTGIKQAEIDPASGKLLQGGERFELASRPGVTDHPIEGASLYHHDQYYYLFVSIDFCCNTNNADDNYKIAVGRSRSPHGPFFDEAGTAMRRGGATVLLTGDNVNWTGVGGEQVYWDPNLKETIIAYQAQDLRDKGEPTLRVRTIKWDARDWPVID